MLPVSFSPQQLWFSFALCAAFKRSWSSWIKTGSFFTTLSSNNRILSFLLSPSVVSLRAWRNPFLFYLWGRVWSSCGKRKRKTMKDVSFPAILHPCDFWVEQRGKVESCSLFFASIYWSLRKTSLFWTKENRRKRKRKEWEREVADYMASRKAKQLKGQRQAPLGRKGNESDGFFTRPFHR